MTIIPVPFSVRITIGLFDVKAVVGVVAGVFLSEEVLDVVNGHRVVVRHDGVADDIPCFEAGRGGGGSGLGARNKTKGRNASNNGTNSEQNKTDAVR